MSDQQGHLPDEVTEWVQRKANEHFGGDWGRAAAAILEAAYAAEQEPDNPWARQETELRKRRGT